QTAEQDVNLRSAVPVELKVPLTIGPAQVTVEVNADAADLLDVAPVAHVDIDRAAFEKIPESGTSSLSSMVTASSPGVVGDSDGQMHGLGDHAQNSFSVVAVPFTNKQLKVS